jgi:thiol-disulfide isomerase/thioredoxin
MKKIRFPIMLIAILLLTAFVFAVTPLYAVTKMPTFSLPAVTDGRPIDSKDLQGKVLLVIFFATWCPPCMEEVPGLIDLQKELSRDGFSVVAFSIDEQGPRIVARMVKKLGVNYPVVMADENTVTGFGGIRGIPTSFLVNQKGDIVKRYNMYVPRTVFAKDIKSVMN